MNARKQMSALAALLAASTLALTACGDDEPESKDKSSESTESTESTDEASESESESTDEESESTDDSSAAAPTGDVTAPGTELSFGEAATVPFSSGNDGSGTLEVTITEIKKGAPADLASLKLGDKAKGFVPYYIQIKVTGVSGSDTLGNYSVNQSIDGVLPDGTRAQRISIIGNFPPCDGESIPGDFADGQSFTTCVPWLAQESTEVSGAQYALDDSDYDSYDGKPVTWK